MTSQDIEDVKNIVEIVAFGGAALWFFVQLFSGHSNHNLEIELTEERMPDGEQDVSVLDLTFTKGANGRVQITDIKVRALDQNGNPLREGDCSPQILNAMRESKLNNKGKIVNHNTEERFAFFVPGDAANYGCQLRVPKAQPVWWRVTVVGIRLFGKYKFPRWTYAQWTASCLSPATIPMPAVNARPDEVAAQSAS
jgi:hypothetical protein